MQYVGIDWAYRRAAWCALAEGGAIAGEGVVPADEDGLGQARAGARHRGAGVRGDDERRDLGPRPAGRGGLEVQVAHARKVRDVAPLACKTDKVDARVLAELCRRDLVPALWVPSLEERALREQLRRRMHLVRLRASAMNRIFGLLTQWGLRLSLERLRSPDAMELLAERGVARVVAALDRRGARRDRPARRAHRAARARAAARSRAPTRVVLLKTIPGVGDLLGLTLASEIGDVARFATPRKLIGYAGLAPRVNQSGDRSRTGALSKAGSRTLRWAAVEAAHAAWRPTNPWHQLYSELAKRAGKNPAKSAVARKILIACLAHPQPPATLQARPLPTSGTDPPRQAPAAFWPPDGPAWN